MTEEIRAVFVDGVGKVQEMTLTAPIDSFYVPRPITARAEIKRHQAKPERSDAEFRRIGKLTDGRHVYGHVVAKLTLWRQQSATTAQAHADASAMNTANNEVLKHIDVLRSESASPFVVLSDREEYDERTMMFTRIVEGVGRH